MWRLAKHYWEHRNRQRLHRNRGGPSGTLAGNTTWGQLGIPYVIDNGGLTVPAGATLTIAPGVVVKFKPDVTSTPTFLNIAGSLVANGTASHSIIFTSYKDDTVGGDTNGDAGSTAPAAGDWAYIQFASGSTGSVSYTTVRYGGSRYQIAGYEGSPVEIGALEIATQSAQPTLANLTVTDNITGIRFDNGRGTTTAATASTFARNTNGVHVLGSATPTITGSTFTDNANGVWGESGAATVTGGVITTSAGKRQIFLGAAGFLCTYSSNTISGAGISMIETQSGNMGGANIWGQVGIPYVIDNGGLTVPAGATLTIAPGVVVKFQPDVTSTPTFLNISGSLTANGTAAQPITFTSYRDDTVLGDTNGDAGATAPAAGDWAYIQFASGSMGSVSYTTVRYGGSR